MAMTAKQDTLAGGSGNGLKKLLFAAVSAGVLLLIALFWIIPAVTGSHSSDADEHETREAPATALQMKVMNPLPGKDRTTKQPATVQSYDVVEIYAQATGTLRKQQVDIASPVKKGELLAEITAPDLLADVAQAAAAWRKSKAEKVQAEREVDVVDAGLEAAKKLVVQREAERHAAESYLKYRKSEFGRYKELAVSKAIDLRLVDEESDRYDSALFRKDGAVAGEQTAALDVIAKKAKLAKARSDVEEAEAAVEVAKAQLDKAKALLGFTKVVAPFDGVITQRNYVNGAFIRSVERGGQVPLLVVQSIDKFRVIAMIPDVDVPFVHEGDPAELVIPTVRPEPFVGKVARTAGSENLKSRTMRVEVDLDNKDGFLRDGMYGYITIHLIKAPKPKFMLPSNTVHEDLETKERYVWVIRQKHAHKVQVQPGPDDGKQIGIMSGLKADDQVVIRDTGLLHEDSEVEPFLVAPARPAREKQTE